MKPLLQIIAIAAIIGTGSAVQAQTRQPAFASAWVNAAGAQVRLVAAPVTDPKPGVWQSAGIEIRLEPGAKTYWRMPGDTGVPPRVDFAASKDMTDMVMQFPAPTSFDDGAGGTAIGYRESLIFPLWYKIARPGPPLSSGGFFSRKVEPAPPVQPRLALTIDFGVCIKNMCMPGQAPVAMEIGQGVLEAGLGDRLLAARYRVPSPKKIGDEGPLGISSARLQRQGSDLVFEVAARVGAEGKSAQLFVEAADGAVGVMQGAPIDGSVLFRAKVRAGSGVSLGSGKLTLVTMSQAIEITMDLDAATKRP